tara:strand:- start:661 stop:831 length:171 start_codon:yes stop_codon:yes gene_type:complete
MVGKIGIVTAVIKKYDAEKSRSYNEAYNTAIYIQDEWGREFAFYPRSLKVIAGDDF